MKRISTFALAAALSTAAFAQCPADPSQTLTGAWTFQITAGVPSVGQFRVIPGAPGTGRATLSVIISARTPSTGTATSVTRYDNGTGSILYNSNCTGGIMFFTGMSFANAQFDFDIQSPATGANAAFGRVIVLRNSAFTPVPPGQQTATNPGNPATPYAVTNCPTATSPFPSSCTVSYPANAVWGTAWPAPTGCPGTAATNPLNLFNGTYATITGLGVTNIAMGAQTTLGWEPTALFTATLVNPTGANGGFAVPPGYPLTGVPPGSAWTVPTTTPFGPPASSPLTIPGFVQVPADCVRSCIYLQDGGPAGLGHGFIGDAYPRITTAGVVSFVVGGAVSNLNANPPANPVANPPANPPAQIVPFSYVAGTIAR